MLLDKIVVSDIAPANTGVIWIKSVGDNYEQSIFLNGKWVKLDKAEEISGIVSSVNNQTPDSNGNVNITKEHIGLGNVNNTSDTEKIVKGASEDGSGNVITTTYETKTDATTKQTALQQAIANLTGLDSTNFGGFSIESTEADAISNIATLYTADGYTDELLWYMAGTSLSSVKAYRYNGSGTPIAISSDSYDCLDFSGLIADVSTLSIDLDALGQKIGQLDEKVGGSMRNSETSDLDISDNYGNVLVRFEDGHIKVKKFDSRNYDISVSPFSSANNYSVGDFTLNDGLLYKFTSPHSGAWNANDVESATIADLIASLASEGLPVNDADTPSADLDISDESGNIICRFKNGHIMVEGFDSSKLDDTILKSTSKGYSNEYDGCRINIKKYTFDIQDLGIQVANTTNLGGQGFAIYGSKAILLYDSGVCDICAIDENCQMTKIRQFQLGSYSVSDNHANVASFGQEKVSGNTIPVVYISKGNDKKCAVENITEESATLVQTISLTGFKGDVTASTAFGYTAGWDGYLYLTGNTISASDPSNKHFIAKFVLPKLSDGEEVELDLEDAVEFYCIEDYGFSMDGVILQGRTIINNLLLMPTGYGNSSKPSELYVWDLTKRVMQNVIDLSSITSSEPEDCDVFNGTLILRMYNNRIYKLKF